MSLERNVPFPRHGGERAHEAAQRIGSGQDRRYRQPVVLTGDARKKPGANQRRLSAPGGSHHGENCRRGPFAGDRSCSAIWAISRPRPKNTRCSPRSNGRKPGYGDLSSGQPHPPPPSITRSLTASARARPQDPARHRRRESVSAGCASHRPPRSAPAATHCPARARRQSPPRTTPTSDRPA